MKIKPISEIQAAVADTANAQGLEILEIIFNEKQNALTFFIDKEGGVTLNDCEKFHLAIDPILDELDPTYDKAYTLNVSSGGLDRAFKTERDFLKNIGKEIEVKLYQKINNKKIIEGVLKSYDGENVVINDGKADVTLKISQTAKISKLIKF